jgi:hypothetical protein
MDIIVDLRLYWGKNPYLFTGWIKIIERYRREPARPIDRSAGQVYINDAEPVIILNPRIRIIAFLPILVRAQALCCSVV